MRRRTPACTAERGRPRRLLLVAFLVGAALAGLRAQASAQAEQILSQRELEYASAQREHESARASWEVQRSRFQNALAEITAAKAAGNGARLESAYQTAQILSLELERLSRRVDGAREALEEEKDGLLEALDLRRRGLEQQFTVARSPQQQTEVAVQIRDLQRQYQSLSAEDELLRPTLVFWPEVDAGPLDGVPELRAKVEILERQIREAVQEQERVNEDIERLKGRERLERFAADAGRSRDRFGDTDVPVGAPGRSEMDPVARATADTTAVPLSERPLSQRIEALMSYRAQLELMREQLQARTRSISSRLPRTQGMDLS